ncbi:MAG TPA: hypothetical protein VMH22_06500 [bacterium]|nr:hypothetical protein [bacterium]
MTRHEQVTRQRTTELHRSLDWQLYSKIEKTLIDFCLTDLDELNGLLETALETRLQSKLAEVANQGRPARPAKLSLRDRKMRRRIAHAVFASMSRQALFLICYARMESALDDLCNRAYDRYGLPVSPQDMKGKGLPRAREYLSKVVGLRLPTDSRAWPIIRNLGNVRNAIAHAGGRTSEEQERTVIAELTRSRPGCIRAGVFGTVELDSTFVPFVIQTFRSFLGELCESNIDVQD